MMLFQPLEEVLIDLEKACRERNFKIFNSERQRYETLIGELWENPRYRTIAGVGEIRIMQEYYRRRLDELKRRLE